MPIDGEDGTGPKTIKERKERVHYAELHTALEQYRDEEMPGKIVGCRYPTEGPSDGMVEMTFAEVTNDQ